MVSDDLVERIAAEVLRRMGGGTTTTTTAATPGAAAVPAAPPPAAPATRPPPAPPAGLRSLVLLTGGDRRLDEALVQLGRIAECSRETVVVLSPTAQKLVGIPAVRRAAPAAQVLTDGDPAKLLEGVDAVWLPNLSLNAASKVARLVPDSLVCILAVRALLLGIPVAAAHDSLYPAGIEPEQVPEAVRARVEELVAELRRLGVRVCHVEKLAAGPAAGATPACSGGGDCTACGLCVERQPHAVQALVDSGAARIAAAPGSRPAAGGLAALIDHTLLKPDATEQDVRKLCEEAKQYGFASVCVNPSWVPLCAELLAGTPVKVCTVIGFPLGATTPTAKAIETRDAIANGASEIDMVINVGALKSGNDALVREDIEGVVQAARGKAIVKVILETALLSREEKIKACLLAKTAGADFVKTSTGFSTGGATVEDIALMRATVGPEMGVKASGGIRDRATAEAMVAAGATRIGASASVAIATGQKPAGKGY